MANVGMLDLRAEWELYGHEIRAAVVSVLDSQQYINGPAVAELETALAKRTGVAHAVAVSNGSDALLCALMAMEIGPGDEVIVPTFTFFATAGAVARVGATPVFVDIDPRTFNLDPSAVEGAITKRTRAIIVVHLFGRCAEMNAINDIAAGNGLRVIEDAAQAIGATYHGRPACSLGSAACLSFYPTKNLGGFGEGGMILTADEELATIARALRNHGESQRYKHDRVGGNFRLDTLKAAALLVKLTYLDDFTDRRRDNAAAYDRLLGQSGVATPVVEPHGRAVYHQYCILSDRRDELQAHLRESGIGTGIYYPIPLHRQTCFASLGYRQGSLPVAERTAERILALPCHPMLNQEDLQRVVSAIKSFSEGKKVSG